MVYIYICILFFFFARAKNHYFSAARLSARRHRFNYKRPFDSNLNIKKDLSGSTSDGWRSGVCGGGEGERCRRGNTRPEDFSPPPVFPIHYCQWKFRARAVKINAVRKQQV